MATTEAILARAAELCRADGIEWRETSASEASEYYVMAERELASKETEGR